MSELAEFRFLPPGPLSDGDLELLLVFWKGTDSAKNWVPAYEFEMRLQGKNEKVGKLNFRASNTLFVEMYGGHVGYHVEPLHRGHHYAERAVRLLLPFVRRHGMNTIWITCNPDNWPSRRTCERLGAKLIDTVELPSNTDLYLRGDRYKCRYRLDLDS